MTERSLLCDADKIRIPPPDRRSATSPRPTPTRPFGDVDQSTPIEHMQLELNKRASRTSRLKRAEDNSLHGKETKRLAPNMTPLGRRVAGRESNHQYPKGT